MAAEKIKKLREWMTQHNVDAYLVPPSDRFQSEYLRPEDERLAWLTGFTGSAGMAIVMREKAALFTDGRYTLQAAQQVDAALYACVESPPASPVVWLKDMLQGEARIAFDPWLLTVTQMDAWKKAAQDTQWDFVGIDENPVDLLWQDNAGSDVVMAEAHGVSFAGQNYADKLDALRQKMHKDAQSICVAEPALVCWLLNMRGRDVAHTPLVHSMACVQRDGAVTLLVDPKKIGDDLRAQWGNHVTIESLDNFFDVLRAMPQPMQIDPAQCPVAVQEFCKAHRIVTINMADPSILMRACKNETEIMGAHRAHEYDADAFASFRKWFSARDFINETITELDVIEKLAQCRRSSASCLDDSFDTIAGFGSNGAIVHYRADEVSNKRLVPDNLLLLDSGGQYREGTTDITRVFAIGTPSAAMKLHYTAVLKGLLSLSMARFPKGTTGAQLDALARAPIWALGLDYAHGTGHGVGSFLSVHEGPARIASNNHVSLQAGMILSIEPGIYLADKYGIRLENLVVVREDKQAGDLRDMLCFETLTRVPFESSLIDGSILSEAEKRFLHDFQGDC